MNNYQKLPDSLKKVVDQELKPGERVLWAAQPSLLRIIPMTAPYVLIGFLWLFLLQYIHITWWFQEAPTSGILQKIVLSSVGIIGICSPIWMWVKSRRTIQLITDQRVMLIELLGGLRVTTFGKWEIRAHTRAKSLDGSEDFMFERVVQGLGTNRIKVVSGFKGVRNGDELERLLQEMGNRY